jgi:SAM-dependent methyltransferase
MNHPLEERTISGLHDFLEKSIPSMAKDAQVLDVGCGTGAWLKRLGGLGYRNLAGIDIDVGPPKLGETTLNQVDLDWEEFPFEDASFDLVTSIEVIEHLENTGVYLREVMRVLKPGGYFLLTTPNTQSLLARLRFFLTGKLKGFDEKGDKTHISPIVLFPFRRILVRHGCEIDRIFHFPEDGRSITSLRVTRIATALVGFLIKDRYPGDIICIICRK